MHETSLVAELVEACERRAALQPVALVRLRHAAGVSADALRQAFRLLTADGPLAAAELELEQVEQRLECSCGFVGALGHDDLVGGVALCPSCGAVSPRRPGPELELLEIRSAR